VLDERIDVLVVEIALDEIEVKDEECTITEATPVDHICVWAKLVKPIFNFGQVPACKSRVMVVNNRCAAGGENSGFG